MANAIETEGLVKQFGATRALDGVDLRIREGSCSSYPHVAQRCLEEEHHQALRGCG
jgi:hypothetical protein